MDALTDILNTLKLTSSLYFRTELSSPWGIAVPEKGKSSRFHIVTRGQCIIEMEDGSTMHLSNGDLMIMPHGAAHTIKDAADTPIKPLEEVLEAANYPGEGPLVYGGGGAGCCLVCGEFSFDNLGPHPLLENLPSMLCVEGSSSYAGKWMDNTITFIAAEAANQEPGANAIVNRLSEIILIQVLRATLEKAQNQIPFLSAFADKRINMVMTAIHANPEHEWTVESLGQLANMSRSSFSNRFTELVQMTPAQYLIFVRLQKASQRLVESQAALSVIAEEVGYQSEAAFSQSFKKHFGIRPGEFRRKHSKMAA